MIETLKRITPEEVLESFVKNGHTPVQRAFAEKKGVKECVCGLSSLIISEGVAFGFINGIDQVDDFVFEKLMHSGYTRIYLSGFTLGFDRRLRNQSGDDERSLGSVDGQAAWEAVKHLAVVE